MRRLALVARSERESDAAHRWLSTLPSGGVWRFDRLAEAPLDRLDALWVSDAEPDRRLMEWLATGGRLLATLGGCFLPSALGLERVSPHLVESQPVAGARLGLAGFGAHPLFEGLRHGALLGGPGPGSPAVVCHDDQRPTGGGVVAVERFDLEVHPGRIVAWEYAVGSGGILCIGMGLELLSPDPVCHSEIEIVLANALVGDAIPHKERAEGVPLWPARGREAVATASGAAAGVVADGAWPPSSLPALDIPPAAGWTQGGRRLLVSVRPASGHREVWAPPFRVMHEAMVRNAIPCAPVRVAADEIAGGLAVGDVRLLERWAAAADVPAVVWEIGGQVGVPLVAEWAVDLRRAWPFPDGAYGDLGYEASPDGLSLTVRASGGIEARFAVSGGTMVAHGSSEAPVVRVVCTGVTPLRIVALAGAGADDLARAVAAVERDGPGGLAAGRARRASQLHRLGTALEAPDAALADGFEWARLRGDESLLGVPGVGRSILAGCPRAAGEDGWCFGAQACAAAAAQLVAGHRDPAHDLLKFLAQTQHPDGSILALQPLGGLASTGDAASTIAFLRLAERYVVWTGDQESLRRSRRRIARALVYLAAHPEPARPLSARVLDALEPLVDSVEGQPAIAALRPRAAPVLPPAFDEAQAVLEAGAAALRRDPGALPGQGAAPALLQAVAVLWGLEPDAPSDALAVTPWARLGWPRWALRRLRVGRTVLDLELRRRGEWLELRMHHRSGNRLVVTAGVRGAEVGGIVADEIELPGPRARLHTHERHEIRFHLRGG